MRAPGLCLYILVKSGFTDALVRALSQMHECNQQIIKSNPRIELVHGTSEGSSPSKSSSLDSESIASPVVPFATTQVGDIVLRGPTTPPRNDVASGTAHTRGTDGEQMSARRLLFDTFGRISTDPVTDVVSQWVDEHKYAIQLSHPSASVLIGSGRVAPAEQSSRVQCLQRANVGDFFRVWSVNLKFVLLTAHEGTDALWDLMSQMFAGQALFFQVGLQMDTSPRRDSPSSRRAQALGTETNGAASPRKHMETEMLDIFGLSPEQIPAVVAVHRRAVKHTHYCGHMTVEAVRSFVIDTLLKGSSEQKLPLDSEGPIMNGNSVPSTVIHQNGSPLKSDATPSLGSLALQIACSKNSKSTSTPPKPNPTSTPPPRPSVGVAHSSPRTSPSGRQENEPSRQDQSGRGASAPPCQFSASQQKLVAKKDSFYVLDNVKTMVSPLKCNAEAEVFLSPKR